LVVGDLHHLPPPDRRKIDKAAILAATAALVGIALNGGILVNGSWKALFAVQTWQIAMSTTLATSAFITVGGLGIALSCLRIHSARSAPIALVAALVAVAGLALTGGAATAEPRWLSAPTVAIHALCAAFWLGSLWPLWAVVRKEPPAIAVL